MHEFCLQTANLKRPENGTFLGLHLKQGWGCASNSTTPKLLVFSPYCNHQLPTTKFKNGTGKTSATEGVERAIDPEDPLQTIQYVLGSVRYGGTDIYSTGFKVEKGRCYLFKPPVHPS